MKILVRSAAAVALTATLAACGGGGGPAPGIPAPPPAPPPPPPPPPAPPPTYSSFAAPTGNQQVAMTGVVSTATDTQTGTGYFPGEAQVTAAPYSSARLSISYNAASNSYTVQDGARSREFLPADIRSADGTNGPAFVNYARNPGTRNSDYLSLYRPVGAGGDDVALTYTTLAMWTHQDIVDVGSVTETRRSLVWGVGGFETLASDMPLTGTASFSGPLRGYSVFPMPGLGAATGPLTGQARLTADFGLGTVQARLTANRSGYPTLLLEGAGTISANRFGGNLSGNGFSGPFDGAFHGPRAAEMGLSFSVTDAAGARAYGVGAGRQ